MTGNHSAQRLDEIMGEIADAELDHVTGGEKAATTKGTTKPKVTNFLVVRLEQVLVSSY